VEILTAQRLPVRCLRLIFSASLNKSKIHVLILNTSHLTELYHYPPYRGQMSSFGSSHRECLDNYHWITDYTSNDKLVLSLTKVPTECPAPSEPNMVNTVRISTYVQPKYATIIGRRNGLTALLPRKMAIKGLPTPF